MLKLILLFIFSLHAGLGSSHSVDTDYDDTEKNEVNQTIALYEECEIDGIVSYAAFKNALEGSKKIRTKEENIITVIDFSKPSTEKRLLVLDIAKKQVLYASHVAHGTKSGDKFATSFSNKNGSHKSSLGFYLTGNTYNGRAGFSLRLNGLEPGINDKALERGVVIHGAKYADPALIADGGRLGRSQGCPALPPQLNKQIIDTIKEGSVVYIYAEDEEYRTKSNFFNSYGS